MSETAAPLDDVGAFYDRLARRLHRLFKESTHGVTSSDIWCCVTAAGDAPLGPEPFDFAAHLQRQREFSERTFGPGARAKGVVAHIRKELLEIEATPDDLTEWIDVAILALDGAWRTGATPQQIIDALMAKQSKNESRTWPDWRTMDPDGAIEHDRSKDRPGAWRLVVAEDQPAMSAANMERLYDSVSRGAQSSGNSGDLADVAECHRCGATSDAQAETVCIPDGDSCPGCEKPLADQWKAERETEISSDAVCKEPDGCPTEMAVLKRFWRAHKDAERAAVPAELAAEYARGRKDGWEAAEQKYLGERAAEPEGSSMEARLTAWLANEMPAGTVIGDPAWWAKRIAGRVHLFTADPQPSEGARVVRSDDVMSLLRECALYLECNDPKAPPLKRVRDLLAASPLAVSGDH